MTKFILSSFYSLIFHIKNIATILCTIPFYFIYMRGMFSAILTLYVIRLKTTIKCNVNLRLTNKKVSMHLLVPTRLRQKCIFQLSFNVIKDGRGVRFQAETRRWYDGPLSETLGHH